MLADNFGRIHNYLRISLTDKCNLRCSYCMPDDLPVGYYANSVRMLADEIDKIAFAFIELGITKIRLTGGEPLVRKESRRIIQLLSKYPVELTLTTNGIFVDEFIDTFIEAGIKSVNVSLDTLQRSKFFTIAKRDNFERVFANINLLLNNNFSVKVNVVLMKDINDDEVFDFIELTKNLKVHVRFIEFMPFLGNKWESEKVISYNSILEKIVVRYNVEKLENVIHDTAKKFKVKGHQGTFAFISTMSEPFCGDCNRLRLTSDGKIKNCLFSKEEIDLLTPLRKGEDIKQLIISSVKAKKERQGGQFDSAKMFPDNNTIENRSMVSIGG